MPQFLGDFPEPPIAPGVPVLPVVQVQIVFGMLQGQDQRQAGTHGVPQHCGRSGFEQAFNNLVRRDAFAFGREIHDDAVPQCRARQGLNVIGGDMGATIEKSARLAAENICANQWRKW